MPEQMDPFTVQEMPVESDFRRKLRDLIIQARTGGVSLEEVCGDLETLMRELDEAQLQQMGDEEKEIGEE